MISMKTSKKIRAKKILNQQQKKMKKQKKQIIIKNQRKIQENQTV